MIILQDELKKLISIPNNIYDEVSLKITEVEDFKPLYKESIPNLVVGYVLDCIPHANSDHLSVTTVDAGTGEPLQIVCGAPNVKKGQTVIVAKIGATLPGDFKISEVTLRGVKSSGMICSLKEIGLEEFNYDDTDGIFVFDRRIKPGTDAIVALGLNNFLMDISITPNRGDLLSYYGFAQDLAAVTNKKIKHLSFKYKTDDIKNDFKITIEDPDCYYYSLRYFEDVKIKRSPDWLVNFLVRMGLKPQNNVVDITNYILFKYGTPLHAFDADSFTNKEIIIRKAEKNEKIKTLDEKEHKLFGNETLITNDNNPIALGGVMGLEDSKIKETTKNIALEGAIFSRENTALTVRNTKIESDSSLRFQRGVSKKVLMIALEETAQLLKKYAGAKVSKNTVEKETKKQKEEKIKISIEDINSLLGFNLTKEKIINIFEKLNCKVFQDGNNLTIIPPLYRFDLLIKEDLIEEVGRIYGYNNIKGEEGKLILPLKANKEDIYYEKIRQYLTNKSFYETVTHSLVSEAEINKYSKGSNVYKLLSPLKTEKAILRTNLVSSLLSTYLYNLNRENKDLNFFEISNLYTKTKDNKPKEDKHLAVLLSTSPNVLSRLKKEETIPTFFTLKAVLEEMLSLFLIKPTFVKSNYDYFHPGFQADIYIGETYIGYIGQIYPSDQDVENVFYYEVDLNKIYDNIGETHITFKEFSSLPSVKRDIAFIISKEHSYLDIKDEIVKLAGENLVNLELFDVFNNLEDNTTYSLAFRLTFNDFNKTLDSDEINKIIDKVKQGLQLKFNIKNR